MKTEARQLIEIVSVVAVVASLVFVGMQLYLDRKVALADQYFNRAEAQRADMRSLIESETYFEAQEERWNRGERPAWWNEEVTSFFEPLISSGKMSVKEYSLEELRARIRTLAIDNLYFQYRQGLLTEDDWNVYRQIMKTSMIRSPVDRFILANDSRGIQEVVQDVLDEL